MSSPFRAVDVPVEGGDLRVGVRDAEPGAPTVLLVHGVTSSHLAWTFTAEALPGVRLIAPDLRGRGRSRDLSGPAGMRAHADDLAAVLDHFGVDSCIVVGHSMGAFVAVVLAHRHPERVERLVLIDGGLPLDAPEGVDEHELVAAILGPTAARLSLRFADTDEYLGFWRAHPAFAQDWTPELEDYLAYDLVPDGDGALQPATAYDTVVEDTIDMNSTSTLPDALAALRHPVRFATAPRGLQDEVPGLYSAQRLPGLLEQYPDVAHELHEGVNHYTIVMSPHGGERTAEIIRDELALAASPAGG